MVEILIKVDCTGTHCVKEGFRCALLYYDEPPTGAVDATWECLAYGKLLKLDKREKPYAICFRCPECLDNEIIDGTTFKKDIEESKADAGLIQRIAEKLKGQKDSWNALHNPTR